MFIFKYSPIYIRLTQIVAVEKSGKSYQLLQEIPSPTPIRQTSNYVRHIRLFLTADWKLTFKLSGLIIFEDKF